MLLLMDIFRALFYGKPDIGELYKFTDPDPFADEWFVRVLDVKNGYVQFKTTSGRIDSMSVSSFNFSFKKERDD